MSTTEVTPSAAAEQESSAQVVNDFSIEVATVNGSGSQTANTVLMRSIFQMGIPVSGKNLFPSNIAGLPTWFTIRASKQGYIGRKKDVDILVAMNPETAKDDVVKLASGAAVVYDEPLKLNELRSDLHFYAVPFDKLVAPVCPEARLRKLVRNMIYDGVLAHLLGIDFDEVHKALAKQFGARKAKAAELNWNAVVAGRDFAAANLAKTDPYRVERMDKTAGKLIIEGNAAIIVLVPLLMPTVKLLGIDPIQFGIIMILNLAIGCLTPPMGTVMFIANAITGTKVGEFVRESLPL